MTFKIFHLALLLVVAANAAAQNEDELQIPVENDNQFPPDNHSDVIEGSGFGVIDEPNDSVTEITPAPAIEHVEAKILMEEIGNTADDTDGCPKPCVCHTEGSTNDFVIDCSGYDLSEVPTPLNDKVTVLNIQKNKITEIPKQLSNLKKLKVLNANDNSIMNLAYGSVSELPELVTLRLANNRLIEYPNDLKNSFGLTKLELIDLSGNDMRTELKAEVFKKFESLRTLILPTTTVDLEQDLCISLSPRLLRVCTISCEKQMYDCQEETEDGELHYHLPAELSPMEDEDDNADPSIGNYQELSAYEKKNTDTGSSTEATPTETSDAKPSESVPNTNGDFSFRSAVNKQPSVISPTNVLIETPSDIPITNEAAEIGAATLNTKTGGVDKGIIGLVVAGMIVIVAIITIKKNWSSIRNRFGSNSNNRTPNERVESNANGTTPEEVPLQEKSPV